MPQYELSFWDYWRILTKRRFLILFTFLGIFSLTMIYLYLQSPVYEAFATVKIEQRRTLAGALLEYLAWSSGDYMATQAMIIESRIIAKEAAKRLDLIKEDASKEEVDAIVNRIHESLSTEKIEDTNLVKIIILSDDPKHAAVLANQVADIYVEHDLERKIKQTRQVREYIGDQLAIVDANLKSSENELKKLKEEEMATGIAIGLNDRLMGLRSELSEVLTRVTDRHPEVRMLQEQIRNLDEQLKSLPADELEYARLSRDIKINEKLYMSFREKFEEAQIAEAEKIGDASIVDYAITPKRPIRPNKQTGALIGGAVGLVLSLVLSFVVEGMDTSIGTIEDVESLLKLPVLGVIPHVRPEDQKESAWWRIGPLKPKLTPLDEVKVRLIVHKQPRSPIAESYRTLRTNLKLAEHGKKTILVTSAGPKEGKTTVLINLALTAVQMGNKTLIISTDLRKPAIYQTFGIKREPGLNEILSGTIKWKQAVNSLSDILIGKMDFDETVGAPGLDKLNIMTSGHIPINPAELLGTKEMAALLEELKAEYDIIFLDSPPTLPITDAIILAPKMDGVLIVYEIGRTAKNALVRTKTQLEIAGANVLGIILNHITPETEMYPTYYPYYSRYRYYGKEEKKGKRKS